MEGSFENISIEDEINLEPLNESDHIIEIPKLPTSPRRRNNITQRASVLCPGITLKKFSQEKLTSAQNINKIYMSEELKLDFAIKILQIESARRTHTQVIKAIDAIKSNIFFEQLIKNYGQEKGREISYRCCKYMTYRSIKAGEIIFKEGDVGNEFFIILTGSVKIIFQAEKIKGREMKTLSIDDQLNYKILKEGQSFGENALIYDTKRTTTVKSFEDCEFGVLSKMNYWKILG